MKTMSRFFAIHLKICMIATLLMAGCDTSSPKTDKTTPDKNILDKPALNSSAAVNSASQQSSTKSNLADFNQALAMRSSASVFQSSKATSSQTFNASNINKQTTSSYASISSSHYVNPALSVNLTSAPVMASSSSPTIKNALVGVSGIVKLTGRNGEAFSPEGVIVNLEPTNINDDVATNQRQHEVQMKDKTYQPKFMTVRKNDRVNFSNSDKIKHNVFSTSAGNGFDLGTFGEGGMNNTVLKTPGIVKVYCNIHPEMAFFISVSQHNYSYITNESGAYEINNLPPGEYKLSAWHVRGEIQQVINLQTSTKKNILINAESYVPTAHKNKFGEDYKVAPALFKDEFY